MNPEIAARLQSLHIEWFASAKGYTFFTRENCAAVAHERAGGFSLGSSGVMTEAGFAYLVWREGVPFLAAHGGPGAPAPPGLVDAVRRFSEDLKVALA